MAFINISSALHFISKDLSERIASYSLTTFFALFSGLTTLILLSYFYIRKPSRKVYLIDFACYKPPPTLMCTKERVVEVIRLSSNCSEEMLNTVRQGMYKGGLGDSTYVAEALLRVPPNPSMEEARNEAEMVIFRAIDELLAKTYVQGKDIGFLIVNCCLFNVVPSLSDMIVHRYELKENIATYNLTGMGCSAGLLAIGLANQLLQVHHDQCALVVTTEIITMSCYKGKDRSKMATNCLFRLGGAAVLLSNRSSDRNSSKYQLIHTVHANNASSDLSYNSIIQEEDDEGLIGVSITKDLLVAAKTAIESNLVMLGPLVLPLSEKINFLKNLCMRRFLTAKMPRYVPRFNKCIDHFFPHVGGKPVLDQLQKILGFSDAVMEASRMVLYRFGNTSSSSVWYEIAYTEAKGRIKKGDSLWQIAFGSGFKCSSLIWRAMRTTDYVEMNPWRGEIDQYPINLDRIGTLDSELFFLEQPK